MTPEQAVKKYFGYDSFRPGQQEVINALMNRRDVLAVMPTGAGKSLCYQVPAACFPGITIVVSPLIALMQDQVRALNTVGIRAAYINSSLNEVQISKALNNASHGVYKVVYVAPERLDTQRFRYFSQSRDISIVAVDEAHCISQWGQDFRPSYLKIADYIASLPVRPVIGAFTATATAKVESDIIGRLRLNNPSRTVTGFDRPNLYFSKFPMDDSHKPSFIKEYLRSKKDESGIIYCSTRKNVDELHDILKIRGYSVAKYHAGMEQEERRKAQEDFIFDRVRVMIATNAFGMGVDKSNVRFVIHYNPPTCLENYYQEAGRAGRDGESSECIVLYSKRDYRMGMFLLEHKDFSELSPEETAKVQESDRERYHRMNNYLNTPSCLRNNILWYFGEHRTTPCGNCGTCCKDKDSAAYRIFRAALRPYQNGGEKQKNSGISKIAEGASRLLSGEAKKSAEPSLSKITSESAKALTGDDRVLFDELRTLRLEISRELHLPPYIIFNDSTLAAMSRLRPVTKQTMLQIPGVGEIKLNNYGPRFIDAIRKHSEK